MGGGTRGRGRGSQGDLLAQRRLGEWPGPWGRASTPRGSADPLPWGTGPASCAGPMVPPRRLGAQGRRTQRRGWGRHGLTGRPLPTRGRGSAAAVAVPAPASSASSSARLAATSASVGSCPLRRRPSSQNCSRPAIRSSGGFCCPLPAAGLVLRLAAAPPPRPGGPPWRRAPGPPATPGAAARRPGSPAPAPPPGSWPAGGSPARRAAAGSLRRGASAPAPGRSAGSPPGKPKAARASSSPAPVGSWVGGVVGASVAGGSADGGGWPRCWMMFCWVLFL